MWVYFRTIYSLTPLSLHSYSDRPPSLPHSKNYTKKSSHNHEFFVRVFCFGFCICLWICPPCSWIWGGTPPCRVLPRHLPQRGGNREGHHYRSGGGQPQSGPSPPPAAFPRLLRGGAFLQFYHLSTWCVFTVYVYGFILVL